MTRRERLTGTRAVSNSTHIALNNLEFLQSDPLPFCKEDVVNLASNEAGTLALCGRRAADTYGSTSEPCALASDCWTNALQRPRSSTIVRGYKDFIGLGLATVGPLEFFSQKYRRISRRRVVTSPFVARAIPTDNSSVVPVSGRLKQSFSARVSENRGRDSNATPRYQFP